MREVSKKMLTLFLTPTSVSNFFQHHKIMKYINTNSGLFPLNDEIGFFTESDNSGTYLYVAYAPTFEKKFRIADVTNNAKLAIDKIVENAMRGRIVFLDLKE